MAEMRAPAVRNTLDPLLEKLMTDHIDGADLSQRLLNMFKARRRNVF